MYRLLILLMLIPRLLLADSDLSTEKEILESNNLPLATIYGLPETNICGVNVINGDYNFASIDFNLPGAESLTLQRSYCSSNFQSRGFYHSWTHNLCGRVKRHKTPLHQRAVVSGGLSGELPFKRKRYKRYNHVLKISKGILKKGITNCGQGEISGRYNIKNMRVSYSYSTLDVKSSDGTIHNYQRNFLGSKYYSLEETIKQNGVKIIYDASEKHIINCVELLNDCETVSSRILFKNVPNNVEAEYKKSKEPFFIIGESNDGKIAKYFFDWHEKHSKTPKEDNYNILLSKFESSHLPTEYYNYTDPEFGVEKLSDRYGRRHRIKIDYYQKGDIVSPYGIQHSEEVDSSHVARHRVKKIEVAVNSQDDLRAVACFDYYRNNYTEQAFTDVYNEYNQLLRFHYSMDNNRLECVEKFKGSGPTGYTILRRERLFFGGSKSYLEGDLLSKTVEAPDDTIHYGENFEYDQNWNVLRRTRHFRRFTDLQNHPIYQTKVFSCGTLCNYLEGGEVQATSYTYNESNLPTSEYDGRLEIFFNYHKRNEKETNLLKSKLFKENNKIIKREFYKFDTNAGCTLKIEDDGSGYLRNDLTDVHVRRITKFFNRKYTFAGLPLEIDEWGANGENEQRIGRTILKYDSHGYVEKELHYDADNNFAYKIQKIRDIQGNITSETNAEGQVTHRKFNEYGCLLEEQGPMLDYHMAYEYNWLQRPLKETRYCKDGIHLTTIRRYDLAGRLVKIKDPYGLNTKFEYNEDGKITRILHPPIRTNSGWVIPEEFKEYNFLGHLTSETDARGATTYYTPNDAGLPLKITYPDGSFETFNYSIYGEVIEKRQRNGTKVFYTYDVFSRPTLEKFYDEEGNFLKETSKKYIGNLLLSETDGEGLETSYTYDYAGRVSEVHQGKALTKYFYDPLGRVREEQRYYNKHQYIATQYKYNLLNKVIEEVVTDEKGQHHSRKYTTYDADGNITSTTESSTHAGRAKTRHTYDPRGNLSSTTDPLGNTTVYQRLYDVFFEEYNLPCLEVTDPAGVKSVTISDARGSPVSIKIYSPFGELLSHEEMFYDLQGNLVRKKHHLSNETIVTLWKYDSSSRLIRKTHGAGTEEQIKIRYVYNSCGQLSEIHYADGSSKYRTYDALGRLWEEWSNDNTIHYKYKYNRQDLLTYVKNCNTNKRTIREYTLEKDLKSERFENGLKIAYEYDRLHRVIECIYPDQSSVKQRYNPVSLEKSQRFKNGDVIYEILFKEFDLTGKPQQVVFPKKGGTLLLKYDRLHRPLRLLYPHYNEKDITYEERGLLTSREVDSELETYKHDYLRQLTSEKTVRYSHTYKNDSLYRQTSVDDYEQTHNAVHQLVHGIHGKCKFDQKGRRVQDKKSLYFYDKFDRLESIQQGDHKWTYTYDAFSRKMSHTFDDKTIYYLYDGHEEIGSFSRKQDCYDLKVLAASEGTIPIAIELGEDLYSPIISSQGHIVGLADMETGELADRSPLTMFGQDLARKPLSPWRFCGKRHEVAQLRIIDFGYRFYHPKSAQWLTQDPLEESEGPNLYVYVSNTPTRCIDRFGLLEEESSAWSFTSSYEPTWNSIKNTASSAWNSSINSASWLGNNVADYTINSPRFMGTLDVISGASTAAFGAGMMVTGAGSTCMGITAPVGIPTMAFGATVTTLGCDQMLTGLKQCWTGKFQDTVTVKVLQNCGMSPNAANFTELGMSVLGGG